MKRSPVHGPRVPGYPDRRCRSWAVGLLALGGSTLVGADIVGCGNMMPPAEHAAAAAPAVAPSVAPVIPEVEPVAVPAYQHGPVSGDVNDDANFDVLGGMPAPTEEDPPGFINEDTGFSDR